MYLKAFSKKVAIVEQRHMPLKKFVTKETNLYQKHLLSKKFIKEAIEPQKGPLNE
jgi:hypothetical protein